MFAMLPTKLNMHFVSKSSVTLVEELECVSTAHTHLCACPGGRTGGEVSSVDKSNKSKSKNKNKQN